MILLVTFLIKEKSDKRGQAASAALELVGRKWEYLLFKKGSARRPTGVNTPLYLPQGENPG
ncbi:hypothetical protein EFB08_13815 [Rufibacter latericius]|uniref:Uncharacterized protein n=1 Tax=Rufibacter latericius TaxID=2487040 RepID=A0A3M9MK25_9BACT|nr:hypothetical protein EFB08_13815 [Rufibacter latericius]